MAKFEIFKDSSSEFRFRLKANNGEKILSSEGYGSKANAQNGIDSVKENAPKDDRYTNHTSSDNRYYFNLHAANNQVIGTSEMYNSAASRDEGIKDVKRLAPDAEVLDLTD